MCIYVHAYMQVCTPTRILASVSSVYVHSSECDYVCVHVYGVLYAHMYMHIFSPHYHFLQVLCLKSSIFLLVGFLLLVNYYVAETMLNLFKSTHIPLDFSTMIVCAAW